MRCDYFSASLCGSCTHLLTAYDTQLSLKQSRCERLIPAGEWLCPVPSAESGFRNKAKLVVGGAVGAVTLGILDGHQKGVDLRKCGLYEPALAAAIPVLADLIDQWRLLPYDVGKRRGELKNLIVTASPDGELMVRFVLRSTTQAARITAAAVQEAVPNARVVSLNVQPEHKAILEGETESILSQDSELAVNLDRTIFLRPQSFFQTNTAIARSLYRQARDWAHDLSPTSVIDAYCGVGGFAAYLATPGRRVVGVDVAPGRARDGVEFVASDALDYLRHCPAPDLLIVNPPRRGIGQLATWINQSQIQQVIYSSCNPDSLAKDLTRLPGFRVRQGRVFDMFPHTDHLEVMTLLERR